MLDLRLENWQKKLVETPPGGRAIALCARQAGKTTATAVAVSHCMVFQNETTSLFLSPTQRQSAEGVRRVRQCLVKSNVKLKSDNAFSLELENGSRVLALPGASDDGIRGLSISGCLVFDEAARVSTDLFHAALPMVSRFSKTARIFAVSTAWAAQGWYYRLWMEGEGWAHIRADITECGHLSKDDIERERQTLGEMAFRREYLCEWDQTEQRFFDPGSIASAFGESGILEAGVESTGEDPIVGTQRAFGNPFKEMRFGRV